MPAAGSVGTTPQAAGPTADKGKTFGHKALVSHAAALGVTTSPREEIGSKLSKKFGKQKASTAASSASAGTSDQLVNTPPPSPEKAGHGKSVRFADGEEVSFSLLPVFF